MKRRQPRQPGTIDPVAFCLAIALAGVFAFAILLKGLADMSATERAACELRRSVAACNYTLSR